MPSRGYPGRAVNRTSISRRVRPSAEGLLSGSRTIVVARLASPQCSLSRSPVRGLNAPGWAARGKTTKVGSSSTRPPRSLARDVGALLCDANADELRDTRNAQLTTFVSSLMVLDAAERLGLEPSFCAGHSLGEYTALTATGTLGFEDGVRLVTARAAAMHDAGLERPGTMAAVLGLDDDQVDVACRRADSDVRGCQLQRTPARSSSPGLPLAWSQQASERRNSVQNASWGCMSRAPSTRVHDRSARSTA